MKSSSIVLLVIIVFTFPIWIGLAGGLFGLVFGLIGGFFGLLGGLIGGFFGMIGAIFGGIFGWGDHWGDVHWHHSHHNGFWIVLAIIAIAIALRKRSSAR